MIVKNAAKKGMNTLTMILGRRSLINVGNILDKGENPLYITLSFTLLKNYLLIITNKRVIHYRRGKNTSELYSVDFLNIERMDLENKRLKTKIKLVTENEVKIIRLANPINTLEILTLTNELIDKKKARKNYNNRSRNNFSDRYVKTSQLDDCYVVIDFETTGLKSYEDEIIQIGAVKYKNHQEIDRFNTYIKPSKNISQRITDITGITNEMVQDAPIIDEQINMFITFIDNHLLVAHKASFDMGFLYSLTKRGHKIPKYSVIDTLELSSKLMTEVDNHQLMTLSSYLNIEHKAHDALGDCLATAEVYKYCYFKNS